MTFFDWMDFKPHERLAAGALLVVFAGVAIDFPPLAALGMIGLAAVVAYPPFLEALEWEDRRRERARVNREARL